MLNTNVVEILFLFTRLESGIKKRYRKYELTAVYIKGGDIRLNNYSTFSMLFPK